MPNSPTLLAASIAAAFGPFAISPSIADPLPTGGKVVAGQASISKPAPNTLQVQQGSANAAIDWQSFSVGRDASVTFQQPSARSIVLNRVVGSDPSQILGRIQANGQVFLINPYGIVFGRDAKVDVAGLVASTANIRNDDFMAGRLRFTSAGQPGAAVVNEGQITVREGGLAALMAPSVANRGTITARLGTVALASGEAFTLDPYGDRLIGWVVPASQLSSVINEGTLSADGGSVQISARAAASVVDGVINLGGTVRARSVGEHGGRVVLDGDRGVLVAGSIDARGVGSGERGGSVQASGATIRLTDAAVVDATGDAGGGTVHLGGGWRGAGGSGVVASTSVDRGARIDVSAVNAGAGGETVVWSEGRTTFNGHIDARGATKGGQVEVSGHRLAYDGSVDAAAAHGTAGTLLLDPGSLVVQSRTAAAPAAGTDVVTTESVNTQLAAGTNVQLTATQDLTVAGRIDARLVSASGTRINAIGANLALSAGGNLALNSDVILDGGSFSGTAGGRVSQASTATLATGGGDVTLQAAQGIALRSVQGARNLALTTTAGSIELAAPIGLTGRFTADVMQAQAGDRVHLNGLLASSPDAQPAVAIDRAAGNNGPAAVQIDDHLIAAGNVFLRGSTVTLAATKAIDTRAGSGGKAGSTVSVDAGQGGIALNGNLYTDNAAVALSAQGDVTQAIASAIGTGTGAITFAAGGTATVSRIQTSSALAASGARVVFDAGTTDTTVQAGTLQVGATGSAANAVDVRSSIKLAGGDSSIVSANDVTMRAATLIETGATGALTIDASRNITIELLKSSGAGTLIRSARGNVKFNQDLGGRAAGDATTARTKGNEDVIAPTLYALDVRAPEGTIEAKGLLLYGLKDAPLTLDMPAPGNLAYGLNLAAKEVDLRGLVFVFDGAVSIQGTQRLVIGNNIRSANGYAMAVGGGELDFYRPTRPDGSEYKNTDIIVAQYADGSLKFFEQLSGVWQESTSFFSVVMPADLPRPTSPVSPAWLDRSLAHAGIVQASLADPAFARSSSAPLRLVSLRDSTSTGTNAVDTAGLASYDPSNQGRHPYVPLVYSAISGDVSFAGTVVTARDSANAVVTTFNVVDVPGTRFIPKILITNDPGASFTPTVTRVGSVLVTNIGRLTLTGNVFETDSQGAHLVADRLGGTDSGGDLRYVALKVASFDTRSIYQDSRISPTRLGANTDLGPCTVAADSCLDDPGYLRPSSTGPSGVFNDYPRGVYPSATTVGRNLGAVVGADAYNATTAGFQAAGYFSLGCVAAGNCERPAVTVTTLPSYRRGEPSNPGGNPNALSSSLAWVSAQPSAASFGRLEYFQSGGTSLFGGPALVPSAAFGSDTTVLGLTPNGGFAGDVYKIGAAVTQTSLGTGLAATRTVLVVNRGIAAGQGITMQVDGTSAYKTSLPTPSLSTLDASAPPTFSTITPTIQSIGYGNSGLVVASGQPPASVYVPVQPPIQRPAQPGLDGQPIEPMATIDSNAASRALNTLQDQASGAEPIAADQAPADTDTLLVLGGRGLAQSLDLGRSGGLGSTRSGSTQVTYEVACTIDAPRTGPDNAKGTDKRSAGRRHADDATPLPPCR